jgi:hypothetical protein
VTIAQKTVYLLFPPIKCKKQRRVFNHLIRPVPLVNMKAAIVISFAVLAIMAAEAVPKAEDNAVSCIAVTFFRTRLLSHRNQLPVL